MEITQLVLYFQLEMVWGMNYSCILAYVVYFLEQIDIAKPGSYIIINNAKVLKFKGFMRLVTDEEGSVEEDSEPEILEVAQDNLSLNEYELILNNT